MKTRIELEDTPKSAVIKMSEGVIGAIEPLMSLFGLPPANGFHCVLMLDTYGIYGSDIYVLWNDICERKIWRLSALIRGAQLGVISREELKAATVRGRVELKLDVKSIYEEVQKRLSDVPEDMRFPDYE